MLTRPLAPSPREKVWPTSPKPMNAIVSRAASAIRRSFVRSFDPVRPVLKPIYSAIK